MYYKIVALAAIGKKITLHYFNYKEGRDGDSLLPYCTAIHSYPRKSFASGLFSLLPYIVRSRINKELIERLNADEEPILLEGIHCSGIIPYLKKPGRVVIRMHNEEAAYYARLVPTERNILKKTYLRYESSLLRRYYKKLPQDVALACLSQTDIEAFLKEYGFTQVHFIPCFIPWQELKAAEGKGEYCLYHGNLAVPENESAALWLLQEVWDKLQLPLVIAGKGPSERLVHLCKANPHVHLEVNPSLERIGELVAGAQVHVLPSMNSTGVKLKLLHALFRGRFCITNEPGIRGSAIEGGVSVAEEPDQWRTLVTELFQRSFSEEDKKNRQQLLTVYNNEVNAGRLSALW